MELSRRKFLEGAGAAAAAVGAAGAATSAGVLADITPAGAVTDYEGIIIDAGGQVFNVKYPFGATSATGNTLIETGGSIASGSTSFTWTGGSFVTGAGGDTGKWITVQGAGPSGGVLSTSITGVTSSTQVTLATAASTSVSGAAFAYGTDDTVAIASAVTAANSASAGGTVFVPAGIYMIRGGAIGGAVSFSGNGGLLGTGGAFVSGTTLPSTMFLCADSTAGILLQGGGTYQGFCCNGNNIASTPLQIGIESGGTVTAPGPNSMVMDVWASSATGNGLTIYGAAGHGFYDCGSVGNTDDGIYIDGGAKGLSFYGFYELNNGRYGVHGDDAYGSSGTSAIRFYNGSFSSSTSGIGSSKVYLRGATDWKFVHSNIDGTNVTGPTVDLSQSAGYNLDFSGCWVWSSSSQACIQVAGTPWSSNAYTFVKTDGMSFSAGDSSVYIGAVGNFLYSAVGWSYDGTTNGPTVGAGLNGADTLLNGRIGTWYSVAVSSSNWSGTVYYRVNADGEVQLGGSVSVPTGGGSGAIFTLPAGYRPTSGNRSAAAALSTNSAGYIAIDSSGNVTGTNPGNGNSLYLDGITFPVP